MYLLVKRQGRALLYRRRAQVQVMHLSQSLVAQIRHACCRPYLAYLGYQSQYLAAGLISAEIVNPWIPLAVDTLHSLPP